MNILTAEGAAIIMISSGEKDKMINSYPPLALTRPGVWYVKSVT